MKRKHKRILIGMAIVSLLVLALFFLPKVTNQKTLAIGDTLPVSYGCSTNSCPSGYTDKGVSCTFTSNLGFKCTRQCEGTPYCGTYGSWTQSETAFSISPSDNDKQFAGNILSQTSNACYKYKAESQIQVTDPDPGGIWHYATGSVKLYSYIAGQYSSICSTSTNFIAQSGEKVIGQGSGGNGAGAIGSFIPYTDTNCGSTAYGVTGVLRVRSYIASAPLVYPRSDQICSGSVQCTQASDCGTDGLTGSKYCSGNNVAQKYKTFSCGSYKCSNTQQEQTIQSCDYGCSSGACIIPECTNEGEESCDGTTLKICQSYKWVPQGNIEGKCGYSTAQCSYGQTKCEGTYSYSCSGSQWQNNGQVNGKCGYVSSTECTAGQTKCNGFDYYECSNNAFILRGQIDGKCGYVSSSTSTVVYRVVNNICVSKQIPSSEKLSTDFTSLESCQSSLSSFSTGAISIAVLIFIGVIIFSGVIIILIRSKNGKK